MSAQPATYHCPIPECSTANSFTFPLQISGFTFKSAQLLIKPIDIFCLNSKSQITHR